MSQNNYKHNCIFHFGKEQGLNSSMICFFSFFFLFSKVYLKKHRINDLFERLKTELTKLRPAEPLDVKAIYDKKLEPRKLLFFAFKINLQSLY